MEGRKGLALEEDLPFSILQPSAVEMRFGY
jgi:hypothetical protein